MASESGPGPHPEEGSGNDTGGVCRPLLPGGLAGAGIGSPVTLGPDAALKLHRFLSYSDQLVLLFPKNPCAFWSVHS